MTRLGGVCRGEDRPKSDGRAAQRQNDATHEERAENARRSRQTRFQGVSDPVGGSGLVKGADETDNPPEGDEYCRYPRAEEHRIGERVG